MPTIHATNIKEAEMQHQHTKNQFCHHQKNTGKLGQIHASSQTQLIHPNFVFFFWPQFHSTHFSLFISEQTFLIQYLSSKAKRGCLFKTRTIRTDPVEEVGGLCLPGDPSKQFLAPTAVPRNTKSTDSQCRRCTWFDADATSNNMIAFSLQLC